MLFALTNSSEKMTQVPPARAASREASGALQRHDDRPVVVDLDALHRGQFRRAGRGRRRVDQPLEGELHVAGLERGTVVEGDSLAQDEHVAGAVLGDLPALGQRGLDGEVGLDAGQPVVDVLDDVPDGGEALLLRIERGRIRLEPDLESPASASVSRPAGTVRRTRSCRVRGTAPPVPDRPQPATNCRRSSFPGLTWFERVISFSLSLFASRFRGSVRSAGHAACQEKTGATWHGCSRLSELGGGSITWRLVCVGAQLTRL